MLRIRHVLIVLLIALHAAQALAAVQLSRAPMHNTQTTLQAAPCHDVADSGVAEQATAPDDCCGFGANCAMCVSAALQAPANPSKAWSGSPRTANHWHMADAAFTSAHLAAPLKPPIL